MFALFRLLSLLTLKFNSMFVYKMFDCSRSAKVWKLIRSCTGFQCCPADALLTRMFCYCYIITLFLNYNLEFIYNIIAISE